MTAGLSLIQKATSRARRTGKAPMRKGTPKNSSFFCKKREREIVTFSDSFAHPVLWGERRAG